MKQKRFVVVRVLSETRGRWKIQAARENKKIYEIADKQSKK
jgi:uncharacterized protein YlxP (DUF503 family)